MLSSRFLLSVSLALALLSSVAIPTIADTTNGNSGSLPSEYSGNDAPAMTDADIAYMVCRVIMEARNGKTILLSNDLSKLAQEMAGYNKQNGKVGHERPDGLELDDRQKKYGFNSASVRSENAAPGENVVAAMDAWMKSPHHLQNMQRLSHTHIGVGRNGNYWFQEFFAPLDKDKSKAPPGIEVNCDGYNQDPTKNKVKTLPSGSQSNSQSKGNADNSQGGNGGDNNGSNSQNGESAEPKSTPPSSAGRSVSIKTVTETVVKYNTATRQV
ncbi:hypothetical protein EV182_001581 [Spiromyces aspiralis]|uniref:Uncharacterized protein n=1 Tax=Spiromyces aspiralis TaxID=68401 RepID=A0ACC1HTT7_9FUNG|nr:hypothetical protein EV182_001581 [Spiromyces aspiralis]